MEPTARQVDGREFVTVRPAGGDAFVGRGEELAALTELLDAGTAGPNRRTVLIEGEPGIGKTRLVDEALARVSGVTVLRGRADPLDRHRSFGAVLAAIGTPDPDRGEEEARLAALLREPDDRLHVGPGLRSRLIDAVVGVVAARSADGRVVLVLEDLHWADDGTAVVLGELCEPVPHRDVTVVATRRPTPRPAGMRRLEAVLPTGRVEVIELAELPEPEVIDLVTDRVGRPPSPSLVEHVARAGGNPLYVTELVDALAEQGSLVAADDRNGGVGVRHTSLPPSLRITLLRRLSALPEPALEALRLAALLGTSFAVEDLAVGLDEPVPRTVARLDEPLRGSWLHALGDRLTFRHDLVRDALHDDTPEAVRRGLHRHLADRLAAAGRAPHEVAHHLVLGASPPDPEAADWLHAAGIRASSREPHVAVELLEAAVELEPTSGFRRDGLLVALGIARCWAGRVTAGQEVLGDLLRRPHDPAVDTTAALALARSLILGGDTEAAIEVLSAAEERVATDGDRTALRAERAVCCMLRGDLADANHAVDQVLASPAAGDESRCVTLAVRSALLALEGRFADAVRSGEDAVAVAAASGDRETVRRPPQLFLGSVLLDADRFDEGWALLDEGRRASEELGAVWDLPLVHLVTARGRFLAGDLDDALAEAETALALADEVGTRVLEVWGHAIVAHVHLHRTDPEAVRAALQAGEQVVARVGPQVRGIDWLVWARAGLERLEGHDEVARQLVGAVWDGHEERGMRSERRLFGPELVRLHVAAGDLAAAEVVTAAVEELADLAETRSTAAAALHARGLVAADPDRVVAAAKTTAGSPCRVEHVLQALDAAELLSAAERVAEAVDWFETAGAVARDAGMTSSVRRAEAGLRGLGIRSGARGRRSRPRTGWGALTPTERSVADLAAQGLSNPAIGERLYISRRTVQTHLSHVYAKLGIESRVELAAQVARRARRS